MANLTGENRSRYVNHTFQVVATHYDLMNRLMTAGIDRKWRRELIKDANLSASDRFLDLGAGTGDLSREARRQCPGIDITAADFTLEMMQAGTDWRDIKRINADAHFLPFPSQFFNVVASGFLLRNVANRKETLSEQFRVLKHGGKILILDTTKPQKNILSPFIRFYLHKIIPLLGNLITGQQEAYTYLPDSTEGFISVDQLADELLNAGFENINFKTKMMGTVAIHQACKPR